MLKASRLRQVLQLLTPPIIFKVLRKTKSALNLKPLAPALASEKVFFPNDFLIFSAQKKTKDPFIGYIEAIHATNNNDICIKTWDLVYSGGISFASEEHPFSAFYKKGANALENYYRQHQPENIFEKHFLYGYSNLNKDRRVFANQAFPLPWFYCRNYIPFKGEEGLSADHGIQHYGPVSHEKLILEEVRLQKTRASIKKHGYIRSVSGLPRGYFLVNDNVFPWVFRFHIVGGQHRTAALVDLGYKFMYFSFQPFYPRAIYRSQASHWPSVIHKQLTVKESLMVFDCYFRDPTVPLADFSIPS